MVLWGLLLLASAVHRPLVRLDILTVKPFLVVLTLGVVFGSLRASVLGRMRKPIPRSFMIPLSAYLAVTMVSAGLAQEPARAFKLVVALILMSLLAVLVYQFTAGVAPSRTATWLCRAGSALCVASLAGYILELSGMTGTLGFVYRGSPSLGEFSAAPRLVGLHLDPNYFAMNVSAFMSVALSLALFERANRRLLRLASGCFVLAAVSLIATLSRGGILGATVGLVGLIWVWPRQVTRSLVRNAGALFLVLVSACVAGVLVIPPESYAFLLQRASAVVAGGEAEFGRLALWRASWDMFVDHPILGVGLGNSMGLTQYYRYGPHVQLAHSTWLEVLAESGLLGLVAYASMTGAAVRRLVQALARARGVSRSLVVGLLLAVGVSAVQIAFLSAQYEPVVWMLWGASFGVGDRVMSGPP